MTIVIVTAVILIAMVALLHTGDGLDYRAHEIRLAQAARHS